MDDPLARYLSRGSALAAGLRPQDLTALVRSGAWSRIRYGDYVVGSPPLRVESRHLQLVEATAARLRARSGNVASHGSAAVWWDLPTWGVDLSRVHMTRPGSPGVASTGAVHPHRAQLTDAEIVEVNGIVVTTPARTVLDIARTYGFESGVVTADAALHARLTTISELTSVLELARSRRSAGAAARVIAFADGRSESVGESRSRVLFARVGLPEPILQHEIRDAAGKFVARVDFDMERFRTVGEFDGFRKYRDDDRPHESVILEKLREDALRDLDRQVVRWTWPDLQSDRVVLTRFQRAFARAGFPDWTPEIRSGFH